MIHTEQHPTKNLPFFVNGSLQGSERQEVESHLRACDVCRQEVQALQAIRQEVKNGVMGNAPDELGWQRLKKQIRKEKHHTKQQPQRVWQAVAAAAVLAVAIQTALVYEHEAVTDGYQMLGVPDASLQISFYPTVTEAQIRKILNDVNARFVDGPGALGIYRIELSDAATPSEAKKQRASAQAILASYSDRVKYVSE